MFFSLVCRAAHAGSTVRSVQVSARSVQPEKGDTLKSLGTKEKGTGAEAHLYG